MAKVGDPHQVGDATEKDGEYVHQWTMDDTGVY